MKYNIGDEITYNNEKWYVTNYIMIKIILAIVFKENKTTFL